jgi:hypothetical protein
VSPGKDALVLGPCGGIEKAMIHKRGTTGEEWGCQQIGIFYKDGTRAARGILLALLLHVRYDERKE